MTVTHKNPLERFQSEFDARQAVDMTVETPGGETVENAYMNPERTLVVCANEVQKICGVWLPEQSDTVESTDSGVIDDTDAIGLQHGDVTHWFDEQYVDVICDLFNINRDTFVSNALLNTSYSDAFPVVYEGETHTAVLAPMVSP